MGDATKETARVRARPARVRWRVPFRTWALVSCWLIGPTLAGAAVTEEGVSREAERAFRQMKARIPISRDARATDYVQCVAGSIIEQLDAPYRDLDWEIVLFENRAANAFAMPGGKIGVFTGIFRVAGDQHSLAAVLGHEVAHVTSKHVLKRARKQVRNQLLVAAASGALGGGRATADVLSLGAQLGLSLPYDRKQERMADTEGLELMARAGFDPRGSVGLWKNMTRRGQPEPPEFLSTHPSGDDRISDLISHLASSLALFNQAASEGRAPQCEDF